MGAGSIVAIAATTGNKDAVAVNHGHTASFSGVALPAHNHTVTYLSGNVTNAQNIYMATSDNNDAGSLSTTSQSKSAGTPAGSVAVNSLIGETGVGKNMQPTMGMNYIIKT